MSTSTPPPYFPQNKLSPSDTKARKRFIFGLVGCLVVGLLVVAGIAAFCIYYFTVYRGH